MKKLLRINVTGASSAPDRSKEMITGMEEFPPTSQGSSKDAGKLRVVYAKEAKPVGSMPLPAGVKGKLKSVKKAVSGNDPNLLMDKLGERLGFERSGTRLYEALITKHEAYGGFKGGPEKADLEHILSEEHEHFIMLSEAIAKLGGDPTAVTPSANVHATLASGIVKVITDPRTDLVQSLEAILVAELADNDCWEALSEITQNAGEPELASRFMGAAATEAEHLEKVRGWLAAAQGRTGMVEDEAAE
jgi:rubrerythrin